MSERLHVHVPARQLEETLPFLLDRRLQPEVAFKGPDLDELPGTRLREAGRRLAAAGLAVTVHAPFHDLNPGALEPLVHEVTRHRLTQTLAAATQLGARLVVVHPGYDPWKYGGQDHLWLEQSLAFWPPLLSEAGAAGIVLAAENIFEVHPRLLAALLDRLDSPFFGHCFDVGHWRLFAGAVPLPEWFAVLGRRTVHLHLHDNRGAADDHLPIGEGDIDFPTLFRLVAELPDAPSMTLEAHSREALLRSMGAFHGRRS
jgi:sugar phosphate isomerase/epimerase